MDGARVAFELVVGARTSFLVRTNALLELMELESIVGQPDGVRAAAGRGREGAGPDAAEHAGGLSLQGGRGAGAVRAGERAARHILTAGHGARRDPPAERLVFPVRAASWRTCDGCEAPEPEPATVAGPRRVCRRSRQWRSGSASTPRRRPSCSRPELSNDGRRLIRRPGGIAARAGGGGQGGERQRGEREPLGGGAGHGIPFQLAVWGEG